MTSAWLYDGQTAKRQQVTLSVRGGFLQMVHADDTTEAVPPDKLTFIEERGGECIYGHAGRPGWRLGLTADPPPDLADILPAAARYGRWIDRIGIGPAVAAGIVVSAAVLLGVRALPQLLAPMIPESWMQRYGEALVGDFGGKYCNGPGGQAALDRLASRLSPKARSLNIRVVNISVVNAATLPGGNIVVFRELLSESDGPDEFAGVLAHEIAHVEHQDVTEAMIRELGFGLVLGSLGGDVGGQVHQLASLSYSRTAETAADTTAIAMLRTAGISPAPTAKFFDRIAKQEGAFGAAVTPLTYFSTHPVSRDRAARFRQAGTRSPPALTRDEWDALVDICHNDPAQQGRAHDRKSRIAGR